MTHGEFTEAALARTDKGERFGQALFNVLHEVAPDVANSIRGTNADPFYVTASRSEAVRNFWIAVYEEEIFE